MVPSPDVMILCAPQIIIMPGAPPINKGAVVIRYGSITAVGSAEKIIMKYSGHRVVHFADSVLLPGLINLHVHLELPPLLDIIRAKTFPDWVINLIEKKKGLTSCDYDLATRQNIKMLMRTGTTTVAEICTHDISPAILKQSGLRAIIYQEVISMNPLSLSPRLASFDNRTPYKLVHRGLSPHTPYTVSEAALRAINLFSREKDIRLAMHVAESKDEILLLQQKKNGLEKIYQFAKWDLAWAPKGPSSFEYLGRIGILSPHLLAVHAVHVTDKDIKLIKKSKVSIAHCPRSNKETGVGRMPLKKICAAGITVGIGTDSLASSPSLNLWDELRYALRIHRRDGIIAKDLLKLATIGGAKALGLEKEIGSLEAGKRADLIAVPLPTKNTGDIYSDLLRETKSCIMTMVDGKILYKNDAS
jgi:cytosine/adenosine deaminase-related metal-dependent hydrolase